MSSHRVLRVAEAIREVVSTAILHDVADPRVKSVTVLNAEVSGDLRTAVVHVSIMGTETEQNLALRGLKHAGGFLQAKVAARLQMKHTPALSFRLDDSVKKSIAISRLIDEAIASDRHGKPAPASGAGTPAVPAGGPPDEDDDDEGDEGDEGEDED